MFFQCRTLLKSSTFKLYLPVMTDEIELVNTEIVKVITIGISAKACHVISRDIALYSIESTTT